MRNDDSEISEVRRRISAMLASGLITKWKTYKITPKLNLDILATIANINSIDSPYLMLVNRDRLYEDLASVGYSDEEIRRVPLFQDYASKKR